MQHIFVAGAGILGASIAFHLAQGGARVMVCDPDPPGGLATRASWAWINAAWGNPKRYFDLRHAAMQDWHRLSAVPGVDPVWSGSLSWDLSEGDLRAAARTQPDWGYDISLVGAQEAAAREPALRAPPALALLAPGEGAIEAAAAAGALIRASGATVIRDRVTRVSASGVELAGAGPLAADHIVLATGTATEGLAADLSIPLRTTAPAGVLATTKPVPPLLTGLVVSPGLHIRQRPDGSLIAGADFGGSALDAPAQDVAQDLIEKANALLDTPSPLTLDSWTIGHRPTPADGLSAFGKVTDGLSLAVTHSGVTLASVIGRLLADEILTGTRDPLAAPFRPERFA